jgi:hypothetical protein
VWITFEEDGTLAYWVFHGSQRCSVYSGVVLWLCGCGSEESRPRFDEGWCGVDLDARRERFPPLILPLSASELEERPLLYAEVCIKTPRELSLILLSRGNMGSWIRGDGWQVHYGTLNNSWSTSDTNKSSVKNMDGSQSGGLAAFQAGAWGTDMRP